VDSAGTISFRDVTIGRDDGSVVELSSGVAPGDRLVLNVSSQMEPGERVRAQNIQAGKPAPLASTER